ncbi:MAG TPA: TIGR03118 family protein [Phenylobacterium sp.]|uniref:TIGR03118 family protein n=1 Tax=Phenylobacterium sp. TaxID=1871053 RepID=UPI002B4A0183|nr:TIGR03118 family protein [Phenylobacterium sp.]HKR86584.1 TIGR03118 family protein [Phenylobacterium sp.]
MSRLSRSAKAVVVAASLIGPPTLAAPIALSDAQLGAVSAGVKFNITNQVSDQAGAANVTDPLLVNAWGLSQGPGTLLWVANNGSNTSTIYDPSTFAKAPLNVNVPGAPTGTTFVGVGNAFNVSEGGKMGNTIFAFATEGGQLEGWNPTVDAQNAIVAKTIDGAIFKGLTLGSNGAQALLFASDFGHGAVSAFDSGFNQVNSFTDPNLPPNYVPFNVQNLNGELYVTFALKQPGDKDETAGKGLGFVDVFDTAGHFERRLISNGKLNAPWGLAIAPQSFGKFAGALLVGNFGNGKINAYNPVTGEWLGQVKDLAGNPSIDGLWALHTGPNGTIIFSAGPNDETHGLVGTIQPAGMRMWGRDQVANMAMMHH